MKVLADLLSLPLWEVPGPGTRQEGEGESYTLAGIKDYMARYDLNSSTSLEQGYLLLDYHWQHHMGDFTFSRENFPQLSLLRHTVSWAQRKLASWQFEQPRHTSQCWHARLVIYTITVCSLAIGFNAP